MTKGELRKARKEARAAGLTLEGLLTIPKAAPGQGSKKTHYRAEGRKRAAARKERENESEENA